MMGIINAEMRGLSEVMRNEGPSEQRERLYRFVSWRALEKNMQRENRYLVLKRKDIDKHLTDEAKEELENILMALAIAKQPDIDTGAEGEIDCVVVEKDWPMYEDTWKAIEQWVDGQQAKAS